MVTDNETVADLGEFGLIDRMRQHLGTSDYVLVGPGDDAAHIATADGTYVVSTDILIEGRHFRRDWSSAADIGHKAAAASLSDINAVGGVATAVTMAFAAPGDLPVSWTEELVAAFEAECGEVGAHLVGGDVSAADHVIVSVTAMGDAERFVPRSGAQAGDLVAVAGQLGLAAAGYAALSRGFRSPKVAVDAHRRPRPPYAAGPEAGRIGATAMTDVSDGLLADLAHIATASAVAIDLRADAFDVPEAVVSLAQALGGVNPLNFMLTGGDNYALVATFGANTFLPQGWTQIGNVSAATGTDGIGVTVDGQAWEGAAGHSHWR